MKNNVTNSSKIHSLPKPDKDVYIYALIDPRDNTVKYIGLSTTGFKRINNHFKSGYSKNQSRVKSWVQSLRAHGYIFNVQYLEYFDNDGPHVDEAEIKWIKHYKDLGIQLYNADLGGRRDYHNFNSEEMKRVLSERASIANGTPEMRKLFSDKAKEQWTNPETRERILAARRAKKGIKVSDKVKETYKKAQTKACGVKIQDDQGNIFNSMQEAADYYNVGKTTIQRALYSNTTLLGDRKLTRIGGGKKPMDKLKPMNRYVKVEDRK